MPIPLSKVLSMPIPLSKPYLPSNAILNIASVLAGGKLSGDGAWCRKVEQRLQADFNLPHVLLTSSCTHALELAAQLLGADDGDEVIMPSFTFVSTANAVLRTLKNPVFVDIDPRTLNIDPAAIEKAVTPRTRAIMPVHYAGIACDMDAIMAIAAKHNLVVIEDAAHAIGATYKGKPLGAIGDMGCFSWHDTKNICSGEGGALVLRDDSRVVAAEILREKGTNRAQFLRGEVDKYTWIHAGSSFVLSEILAAFLDAQFDAFDHIWNERKRIHEFYMSALSDAERKGNLRLPVIPADCQPNYHLFYLLLPSEAKRDALMRHLRAQGISAPFHYVPLHTSPYWRKLNPDQPSLPVTEDLSARLLRLPLYPDLTPDQSEFVVAQVLAGIGQ
jgi:dTDP-4-amino-4,6-dideoxygalactose transaminase